MRYRRLAGYLFAVILALPLGKVARISLGKQIASKLPKHKAVSTSVTAAIEPQRIQNQMLKREAADENLLTLSIVAFLYKNIPHEISTPPPRAA